MRKNVLACVAKNCGKLSLIYNVRPVQNQKEGEQMKSLLKLKNDLRADTMWIHFVRGVVEVTVIRRGVKMIEQTVHIAEKDLRDIPDPEYVINEALYKFKDTP